MATKNQRSEKTHPKFERFLSLRIREVQDAAGKLLSENRVFYVYMILDPRKPGTFEYTCKDKKFTFAYEPIYVGKGTRSRMHWHERQARNNPKCRPSDPKGNKLKHMICSGLRPIVRRVTALESEAEALAKERILIETIGRIAEGGPLTNYTLGADGSLGHKPTKSTRKKMRAVHAERSPERKAEIERKRQASLDPVKVGRAIAEAHARHSAEKKAEIQQKRRATIAATDAERKRLRAERAAASMRERNLTNPLPIVQCPHCGLEGTTRGLKRWHFDNCRHQS